MRVKVGSTWYEASPGQPIAVELTGRDRDNIAAMAPDATRYAVFDKADSEQLSPPQMRAWLGEG